MAAEKEREQGPMRAGEKLGRLDLVIEESGFDEDGGFLFRVVPDPRRYELMELGGELGYLDIYTRTFIPKRLLDELAAKVPLYDLHPRIGSASDYSTERSNAVREELEGLPLRQPKTQPAPHQDVARGTSTMDVAFLSLDICASTEHRSKEPEAYDRAADILLRELHTLVGQFEASVLKATGDGFIAYLAHPSFTRQCDVIVDLGTTMLHLASRVAADALQPAGLPALQVRIGADYGTATFEEKINAATGFTWRQESSDALNYAAKIQQSASPGTMRIGRQLFTLLHVQWLQRTRRVATTMLSGALRKYPVYEVM